MKAAAKTMKAVLVVLGALTLLVGLGIGLRHRQESAALTQAAAAGHIFQLDYSSESRAMLSPAAQQGPATGTSQELIIQFAMQAEMFVGESSDEWLIQFRPAALTMQSPGRQNYDVHPIDEDLRRTTFIRKKNREGTLASDRQVSSSTMGVVLQVLANIRPFAAPGSDQEDEPSQDLQKQCRWLMQSHPSEALTWSVHKVDCSSQGGLTQQLDLARSQGSLRYAAADQRLVELSYEEAATAAQGQSYRNSSDLKVQLRRGLVLAKAPWHPIASQRWPLNPAKAMTSVPGQTNSTTQKPVSLEEVRSIASEVQGKTAAEVTDRVGKERQLVHFVRQHPDQLQELLALVADLSSKDTFFRMTTVALAEGRNAESGRAMIQLIRTRSSDEPSVQILFGAVAQMKFANAEMLAFAREVYDSEQSKANRDIAGLALGGILQHMKDRYPDQVIPVIDNLNRRLQNAEKRDDQVILLSILGNAGSERSFEVLKPYASSPADELHSFAVESLRFMRDDASYALLESLLAPGGHAHSQRSALTALDFRETRQSGLDAILRLIEFPQAELGIQIQALQNLGRKAENDALARATFERIDGSKLSAGLQKNFRALQNRLQSAL